MQEASVPVLEPASVPPDAEPLTPVPEPVAEARPESEPVMQASEPSEPPPVPSTPPVPVAAPVPVANAGTPAAPRWGRYTHAEVSAKAVAVRRARVQKALDRIMAYVQKKGSVSNDEVEKLDKVVDSTAALYLKLLVARGLLRKVGANRATRYEKPE